MSIIWAFSKSALSLCLIHDDDVHLCTHSIGGSGSGKTTLLHSIVGRLSNLPILDG